jgi:hypothetical protein
VFVGPTRSFQDFVREADAATVDGWSFSWLDGRATEERPPWSYTGALQPRVEQASSLLDVQTGGGEVLSEVLRRSRRRPTWIGATESWPPNVAIARRNLEPFGARVFDVDDTADLPCESGSLDLVVARHPVTIRCGDVARVLASGGTYFAQHVGPGSNAALTNILMGQQRMSDTRSGGRAVAEATAAGLELVDLQSASLRVVFYDIGAVVCFLRKVPWTVPSFTVTNYHEQLRELHDLIESEGQFVSHATRFLIELRQP